MHANKEVLILGAGIVGLSTAIHLSRRGIAAIVVDKMGPGAGASFGNGGLIQRDSVFPFRFPRDLRTLLRIAGNRSIDVAYTTRQLLRIAPMLLRYWNCSAPDRYATIVRKEAALIMTCLDEHLDLATQAGVTELFRPLGWVRAFSSARELASAAELAATAQRDFGVNFEVLSDSGLRDAEPSFQPRRAGAIHWTDSLSLSDPGALLAALAKLFVDLGGTLLKGDATQLERRGSQWMLPTDGGTVTASDLVVALGAFSTRVTQRFGYSPPLFGKRGYHMHYALRDGATLTRPLMDTESGFLLVPMTRGVRLTTGVEFDAEDRPPTPVQLARAEPVAKRLLPLGERVDAQPWMGIRPCMPDMIPVIGPAPKVPGMWCAFGHGHQGLTLGPTTGRMLAEMMAGESPFLDPRPYRADRF